MDSFIVEALFELLGERPFSRITVTEIAKRAGVSRSTYYRSFSSKECIAKRFVEEILEECFERFDEVVRSRKLSAEDQNLWLRILFSTMEQKLPRIKLLVRNGLSPLFLEALNERFIASGEEADCELYKLRYHLGGLYNCFTQWVEDDARMPPNEMAELVIDALPKAYIPILPKINSKVASCSVPANLD